MDEDVQFCSCGHACMLVAMQKKVIMSTIIDEKAHFTPSAVWEPKSNIGVISPVVNPLLCVGIMFYTKMSASIYWLDYSTISYN